MKEIKNVSDLFEFAIGIELSSGELYSVLTKKFAHVEGVASVFEALAKDEGKHAAELVKIRNSLAEPQLQEVVAREYALKIKYLGQFTSLIKAAAVRNLDDAYELAHDLENSEVNRVFQMLATKYVPAERRKQFVASEFSQHTARLREISKQFSDRTSRRSVEALHLGSVQENRKR